MLLAVVGLTDDAREATVAQDSVEHRKLATVNAATCNAWPLSVLGGSLTPNFIHVTGSDYIEDTIWPN